MRGVLRPDPRDQWVHHAAVRPAEARPGGVLSGVPAADGGERELKARLDSRPRGLTPAELRSAYKLPDLATSDQTVAVSIAFHTAGSEKFLAAYRKESGTPPCPVPSGCFRQVNQQGKVTPTEPSGVDTGWDLEATLDEVDDLGGLPALQDLGR